MDTAGIKLGAFVRHLLNARQGGTRRPSTYALGAIASRFAEQRGTTRPHPPDAVLPLTWYVVEKEAEKSLGNQFVFLTNETVANKRKTDRQ